MLLQLYISLRKTKTKKNTRSQLKTQIYPKVQAKKCGTYRQKVQCITANVQIYHNVGSV